MEVKYTGLQSGSEALYVGLADHRKITLAERITKNCSSTFHANPPRQRRNETQQEWRS